MAILGCDFLAFYGLQLDFTDMLLVNPHVLGWHHEHIVHRSRLDNAEGRLSQSQHSANEFGVLSIAHDIDVVTTKQTPTTNHAVEGIDKVSTHKQNSTSRQQVNIACEQNDITCKQHGRACEQKQTAGAIVSNTHNLPAISGSAHDVRDEIRPTTVKLSNELSIDASLHTKNLMSNVSQFLLNHKIFDVF